VHKTATDSGRDMLKINSLVTNLCAISIVHDTGQRNASSVVSTHTSTYLPMQAALFYVLYAWCDICTVQYSAHMCVLFHLPGNTK